VMASGPEAHRCINKGTKVKAEAAQHGTFLRAEVWPRDLILAAVAVLAPLLSGLLISSSIHSQMIGRPEVVTSGISRAVTTETTSSGLILVAVCAILGLRRKPHEETRLVLRLGVGLCVSCLCYGIGTANFLLWWGATGKSLDSHDASALVGLTAASGVAGLLGLLLLMLGLGDILS
jgi:hypothetical protein